MGYGYLGREYAGRSGRVGRLEEGEREDRAEMYRRESEERVRRLEREFSKGKDKETAEKSP